MESYQMKHILTILLSIISLASSAQVFTGTVYYRSSNGKTERLPFAQVYHIEAEKLLETDADGVFTLEVKSKSTLVATYVGYSRDTVIVTPGMKSADFYLTGSNEVDESVITARQSTLMKGKPIKTEVITAAGLCKMACCSLAESFENSASVTVGYSDAITGAKQIKLLGLSGTYTSMLDENRPVMRGIAAPFGLSYVPGQWLESIQIAKGPSSVVNGNGAITGQINMEHRKPTDETPLYVNVYGSSDYMLEANVVSALQFSQKWNTIILAHYSGTLASMDHNKDGFRDDPSSNQFSLQNRWLYYNGDNGLQIRFGIKALQDDRLGGQNDYKNTMDHFTSDLWGSRIKNQNINGYVKVGYPLDEDQNSSIAVVSDFNYYKMDSYFGRKSYLGSQTSGFLNFLYQNNRNENHHFEVGASVVYDFYNQEYKMKSPYSGFMEDKGKFSETVAGIFGEYTYLNGDTFTAVVGARVDYNSLYGVLFAPRATLKWSVTENLDLRFSGGRGFSTPIPLTDNMGVLSTGGELGVMSGSTILSDKSLCGPFGLEEAWTYGGNATIYLPFGYEDNTFLSFEYFRNDFINQLVADQNLFNGNATVFYSLKDISGGRSFTNTYQADFSSDLFEGFNLVATFRYTDAKVTMINPDTKKPELVERPMTSRYKAVLNLQYATAMQKWIFDFTAQLNGPMKLYSFMKDDFSPIYPMLYAQITKKFSGFEIYVGCENITNFRQHDPILNAGTPFASDFNASCVWGPLMGRKFYIGLRYTLWK